MDGLKTEVCGQQKQSNEQPRNNQHSPSTPTTGRRERGNDTSKSTGRTGRQKAATRRNMRTEERVTVQGPSRDNNRTGCHTGAGTPCKCDATRSAQRPLVSGEQSVFEPF